jgi:hypothetical protein
MVHTDEKGTSISKKVMVIIFCKPGRVVEDALVELCSLVAMRIIRFPKKRDKVTVLNHQRDVYTIAMMSSKVKVATRIS